MYLFLILLRSDSGYFMVNLDRNSPKILRGWIPELATAKEVSFQSYRLFSAKTYFMHMSIIIITVNYFV